jgi:hypothetical protein
LAPQHQRQLKHALFHARVPATVFAASAAAVTAADVTAAAACCPRCVEAVG